MILFLTPQLFLFRFICAYSQRKVDFDSVYAWELTPLLPQEYWKGIPPHFKPYWHFYNTPVKSASKHPDSPFEYIRQVATENDFVSMKLDIDSPSTEIPLFEQLVSESDGMHKLVDEFFFELHYRWFSIPFIIFVSLVTLCFVPFTGAKLWGHVVGEIKYQKSLTPLNWIVSMHSRRSVRYDTRGFVRIFGPSYCHYITIVLII